jgi:hypothetical protein
MIHEATKQLQNIISDFKNRRRAMESIVIQFIDDNEIPFNERYKAFIDSEVGDVMRSDQVIGLPAFASGLHTNGNGSIANILVDNIAAEAERRGYNPTRPLNLAAITTCMERIAGITMRVPNTNISTPENPVPRVAVINPEMIRGFKENAMRRFCKQVTLRRP